MGDRCSDGRVYRQIRGIEQERIGGRHHRRGIPAGVPRVAGADLGQHLPKALPPVHLGGAPIGSSSSVGTLFTGMESP